MSQHGDARQHSPAALRNRGPILEVLRRIVPARGTVLEVASGSGEHVAHFAPALPDLVWQPTDADPVARASIEAWIAATGVTNVRAPQPLDARAAHWDVEVDAPFDVVLSINMIHIAPWEAAQGLLAGAERVLGPDGLLVLYGPFLRGGRHTAPSNATFDADLRSRDPRWGVRDVDTVVREAAPHGLGLEEIVDMPANNLTLVLRRSPRISP